MNPEGVAVSHDTITMASLMKLLLLLVFLRLSSGQTCTPPAGRPTCVCETDNGVIDLTSIANTNNKPRLARCCVTEVGLNIDQISGCRGR